MNFNIIYRNAVCSLVFSCLIFVLEHSSIPVRFNSVLFNSKTGKEYRITQTQINVVRKPKKKP